MNNSYAMSASSLQAKYNNQASMITAGFAAFMILLMFLLKWEIPTFEKMPDSPPGIQIQLENFPEIPKVVAGGGGGGGNPVQASGPSGAAPYSPPKPGIVEASKDIETNENDKEAPAIVKAANPKPEATKVVENTSPTKATPIAETPAPKLRKGAQMGKTTGGTNTGGGAAENYDRSGGSGTGDGVGRGSGSGGGTGGGTGGGNGTGTGTGNGPRRVSGSRTLITRNSMDAGENIQGKIRAEIRVSADGVGTFIRAREGSLMGNSQAIQIVRDWLRRNKFNKSDQETIEVYDFNIKMGG